VLAEVSAVPENVAPLRRAARSLAERCGASDRTLQDVALAVSEACTNVVIHAYPEAKAGRISLVAEQADDEVLFRVIDDGAGLTPRADSPGMGLGLPLIARLTERFEVRPGRDGRGTELCMAFRLNAAA
jgi:serine/threonine-protein kinase RsbW